MVALSAALSVAEAVSVKVAGNDFPSYYSHVQIDFSRILLRKENEIRCVSCAQDLLPPPRFQSQSRVHTTYSPMVVDQSPNTNQPSGGREITINPYYYLYFYR